jgi:AcrR family transcriptional regulator
MARRTKAIEPVAAKAAVPFHHGRLADAAVDVAFDLICRHGADHLTLRAVALNCGVDHTALYRHFEGKSALLTVVVARGFALLLQQLEPHQTRVSFLDGYVQFALDKPKLYAAMFSAEMRPHYQCEPLAGCIQTLTCLAVERIRGTDRAVAISVQDRDAVLRDWALVHGLVDLWTRGVLRARTAGAARAYIRRLMD